MSETTTSAPTGEPHFIAWDEDEASRATFTCTALEGAECRSWCTTCEETCPGPGVDDDGNTHVWEPVPYCRVISWLEAVDVTETAFDEALEEPQRDGQIDTEWDGDQYLWTYAHDPEPAS